MNENFFPSVESLNTSKENEDKEFLSLESALDEIKNGNASEVVENLSKGNYHSLDHQNIAIRLIESGHGYLVVQNITTFQGLDHQNIAIRLIEKGDGKSVANNLEKFQGLNHQDIAHRLIDGGYGYAVASNFERFQGLDHQDIAIRLIEKGDGKSVANNLEKFQGLNYQDIAHRLIEKGHGDFVAFNLHKFQGLNQDIAIQLIEKGRGRPVSYNLNTFQGLNYQNIANLLIEKGDCVYPIIQNFEKFHNLSIQGFLSSSLIQGDLSEIQENAPDLFSRLTVESFLELLTLSSQEKHNLIETMYEKPFLSEALVKNKYAIKLILKYPTLDIPSQENIDFLYQAKEETKESDLDSLEFRLHMQERLLEYKNNPNIVQSLEEGEINIDEWLNYKEEAFFDLGKEQDVSTMDNIHRLLETSRSQPFSQYVNNYLSHIATIIETTFKKDLQEKKYTEDTISLEEELHTKRLQQKETEDLIKQEELKNEELRDETFIEKLQRRIEGLEKHSASLEQRIANPRTVPAYDRIRGDVVLVKKVFEQLSSSLKQYSDIEEKLHSLQGNIGPEYRKQRIELKKQQTDHERSFREVFGTFRLRMESIEERLADTIKNVLGEGFKEHFLSSVLEKNVFLEDRDHIHSDMRTVHTLLESEEKTSLEGTPMSLGLWNRNPDEDLYLGNYTDCCIRIDSEHMGEESTIADYLTDVGMQVVTIRDEKKDIPVVAAWLWIGKNKKTEEIALVVDNIEAHTDYSIPYQDQLKEQLRIYLETYAKNIGIKKIVQGKDNNDITVFGKKGKYKKLGGYNREDGYFLEAE